MDIGEALKSAVQGMPAMIAGGRPGYRAGDQKLAWSRADLDIRACLAFAANRERRLMS